MTTVPITATEKVVATMSATPTAATCSAPGKPPDRRFVREDPICRQRLRLAIGGAAAAR